MRAEQNRRGYTLGVGKLVGDREGRVTSKKRFHFWTLPSRAHAGMQTKRTQHLEHVALQQSLPDQYGSQ